MQKEIASTLTHSSGKWVQTQKQVNIHKTTMKLPWSIDVKYGKTTKDGECIVLSMEVDFLSSSKMKLYLERLQNDEIRYLVAKEGTVVYF